MNYQRRIEAMREKMSEAGFSVLAISSSTDMQYFIGFQCTAGTLFITPDDVILLTDYRYVRHAKAECPFLHTIDQAKDTSPNALYHRLVDLYKNPVFGYDEKISLPQLHAYEQAAPGVEWKPFGALIARLRAVKDEDELKMIVEACKITENAFSHILTFIRPGMTEVEVAIEIERHMKHHGADQPGAFDIIVASGLRSTYSHGRASKKRIEKDDVVLMDFGCKYNEYCSDFTRTIFMGKATSEQKEVYELVRETQFTCIAALREGVTNFELANLQKSMSVAGGYGQYCGNGAGHGIGLSIFEQPILVNTENAADCAPLRSGNVVTIEPTIYLVPSNFGVRIEDMLVVTDTGSRNMYTVPTKLIELDY